MSVLYVDECGNSGVRDPQQPFFLYGGIFLDNREWRKVYQEINALMIAEKTLIASRVAANAQPSTYSTQEDIEELIGSYKERMLFFQNFYFHATDIIRGVELWTHKTLHERFELLRSIIRICQSNNIRIYVGEFDKRSFLLNVSPAVHTEKLIEYKMLIPFFFSNLEQQSPGDYILVRASGDMHETNLISESLQKTNNFFPEDFIMDSKKSPMLQISDAVLWTLQAYKRIDLSKGRFSPKEQEIIATYQLLSSCNLITYTYNPIYI